jgi:hypothetical protein
MEDADVLEQAEFIEDEMNSSLDFDSDRNLELNDDDSDIELQALDKDDIDIELEELDDESDFMDLDDDYSPAVDLEPDNQPIRSIEVVEGNKSDWNEQLLNIPEDKDDLGLMELHVVPVRSEEIKSHVVETITEDFDEEEFVRKHSPVELESDFMMDDSDTILDIAQEGEEEDIEIPHEEIVEDFYEGDDIDVGDESEEEGLLELSIEGMDGELSDNSLEEDSEEAIVAFDKPDEPGDSIEEIAIPEMDLPTESDDIELVSIDSLDEDEGEFATISQDENVDFTAMEEDAVE